MIQPKTFLFTAVTLLLLVFAYLFYFQFYSLHLSEGALIEEGNRLIMKVEQYKEENGKLPPSLTAIGIEEKEEGPLYYDLYQDEHGKVQYRVSFGLSFGESMIYDSEIQEWK